MAVRSILGALAALALTAGSTRAEPFSFVALGDTAYNLPADTPVYERLTRRINAAKPAFTLHVGDTWGALPCTEANHRRVLADFARFDHPLVYTPGDNEWTDCRKPEVLAAYGRLMAGQPTAEDMAMLGASQRVDNGMRASTYDDPIGSLNIIRHVFFAAPRSLGGRSMPLTQQMGTPENARWDREGVAFATVHVPGSGFGFTLNDERRAADAITRNRAAVEWIAASFADAKAKNAKALVLTMHASIFQEGQSRTEFSGKQLRGDEEGPYFWVASAIKEGAAAFGKPVLLIHGDFHDLIIDRPFLVEQGEAKPPLNANITRLQVFGAPELKAVRVTVEPDTPWVFGFTALHE